jgi:predicted kinase
MRMLLLVGLPGSGKTTYISRLKTPTVVCSADHWFERDGEYRFVPEELGQAHDACKRKAQEAMQAKTHHLVVIDNTSLSAWEREPYLAMAAENGYAVDIKVFDVDIDLSAARNTHGVPREALVRMAGRLDMEPGFYQGYTL